MRLSVYGEWILKQPQRRPVHASTNSDSRMTFTSCSTRSAEVTSCFKFRSIVSWFYNHLFLFFLTYFILITLNRWPGLLGQRGAAQGVPHERDWQGVCWNSSPPQRSPLGLRTVLWRCSASCPAFAGTVWSQPDGERQPCSSRPRHCFNRNQMIFNHRIQKDFLII